MSDLDLDAIEARMNAATEGPWTADGEDTREWWDVGPEIADRLEHADAKFIAHARTDVPALVARVRELESQIQAVRAMAEKGMRSNGGTGLVFAEPILAALTPTEGDA